MTKTIKLYGHTYKVMQKLDARLIYKDYLYSFIYDTNNGYILDSKAKDKLMRYCLAKESDFNSNDGVIVRFTPDDLFTYGFTGLCEGKRYFIYITKENDYAIALEDF